IFPNTKNSQNKKSTPIRLNMRIKLELNQEEFIIRVVNNNWKPGYIRFSGPDVLGFNNEIIVKQLQAEVLFFLFQIIAHNIVIFVTALGSSDQAELNFVGPGYHSSFFYKYHGQRSLIYQSITNTECKIDIYYQENNIRTYTGKFLNDVWSKPDILKNYDSKSLFGLYDQLVIQAIQTYITVPYYKIDQFWTCFDISIKLNNCGINGKQRILSIIADSFEWHEIREKLKISNDLMDAARKYSRINRPGCIAINKPVDGTTIHIDTINHCLLYAFGECYEQHTNRCTACDQLFEFIQHLMTNLKEHYSTIKECRDKLYYFLVHQARK
ncbi:21996_t:CDS:2, partial [Gigaspora rosea]